MRQQVRFNTSDSNVFTARGIRHRGARLTPTTQRFRATFLQRAAVAHQFRLKEKIKDL